MVAKLFSRIYSAANYDALERILCSSSSELMRQKQEFNPMTLAYDVSEKKVSPQQVSNTLKHLYSYHKLKLPVQRRQVELRNISYQGELDTKKYFMYSCTDLEDSYNYNLVLLSDGTMHLVDVHDMPKKQVVAVIQFSPNDCSLSYISGRPAPMTVKGIDWVDFYVDGCCRDCRELVFIPPIPEGVTTLREAFYNCSKLNCPIFLPSTIENCTDMLEGCSSFSNKIILPNNLQITDVQGLDRYAQYVAREVCKNDSANS